MKTPKITKKEVGIIKRAKAGDMSAFNALFYRYKTFVEKILFHYLKDMDEAKDLTNIVFLKVHDKLSTFESYDSFGGWIRTIANRTAIDYLRIIESKKDVPESFSEKLSLDNKAVGEDETDLVNRLTYNQILEYFNQFPYITRKIFELYYVNNLTVEQISTQLSIPTGTIKSTLSRTRRKLKKLINV